MSEAAIANPTWEKPIRLYFNDIDVNHMLKVTQGKMDLGSYESVVQWSPDKDGKKGIYSRVKAKTMPIAPSEVWSDIQIATYKKWMDNGYPKS